MSAGDNSNMVGRTLLVVSAIAGTIGAYSMITDAWTLYAMVGNKTAYISSTFSLENGLLLEHVQIVFFAHIAGVYYVIARPNFFRLSVIIAVVSSLYLYLCTALIGVTESCNVYMLGLLNSPAAAISALCYVGYLIGELAVRYSEKKVPE